MVPFAIRVAKRTDFPAIAALHTASWRDAYRNHLPASYLADRVQLDLEDRWSGVKLKPEDLTLVAEGTGDADPARPSVTRLLLGFISVHCRPHPYIDNLHCSPNHRSHGIGSALLQAAFERLRNNGHKTASLTVLVGNEGARRFYLRHGGEPGRARRADLVGYPVEVEPIHWNRI